MCVSGFIAPLILAEEVYSLDNGRSRTEYWLGHTLLGFLKSEQAYARTIHKFIPSITIYMHTNA
jgi:hypothetical protein